MEQRWTKSGRHRGRFLSANSSWLQGNLTFSDAVLHALPSTLQCVARNRPGRPQKAFEDCSLKVKKRKIKNLVETVSQEELSIATEMKLREAGKKDSASIVKELCVASPKRDQALAVIVDANLSTHQYNVIRQVKNINSKLYPPYYKVKEAKQLCYPSGITVTEISAEVKLQSLIDHTVVRICKVQEVLNILHLSENSDINIIIKWGCDGAEQSRYRQKFCEEHHTDESLFSISVVPLQIYASINNRKELFGKILHHLRQDTVVSSNSFLPKNQ
ncbi:hypothetical protein X777_05483 [Ooceraea biroi]|uniref:Uncharacterized protein n=1 Tax=Ooceraea biroi TaxID=2015173 RepID=A0A026WHF3_OOCBI|nr:hypothetical protein X777_05483 [Ooceraea biroi]